MRLGVLLITGALVLGGCGGDPQTGPAEPYWDRDACERCRMVLSDRNHAAQVRYLPQGKKRSRVRWFDDIGCATLWLAEQPWRDDPEVEIWVTDDRNGKWIDARTATYVKQRLTPMDYGLGASAEPVEGGLNFEQAKQHIQEVDRRFNIRDAHLLEQAKARAAAALPSIEKEQN